MKIYFEKRMDIDQSSTPNLAEWRPLVAVEKSFNSQIKSPISLTT